MKNINVRYIWVVIVLLSLLTSCFKEENLYLKKQWVAFDDAEFIISENEADPVEVTFVYSGRLKDEPITINYSLSSEDAIENSDYTLATGFGTVIIPAGEVSVTVPVFTIIDNLAEDGDKTISIEIESAGNLPIGFPGPDQFKSEMTITIEDNDCAFDLSSFVGNYEVEVNNQNAFVYPTAGISCCVATSLTLGATANTLVDSDFYGLVSRGLGSANNAVIIAFDPATLTATLDPSPQPGYVSGGNGRILEQQAGIPGVISTCTTSFTIKLLIRRQNDNSVGQVATLTYTKV